MGADAFTLAALLVIWHISYTRGVEPLLHLLRHNLTAVSIAVLAVNCLALRPLYPLILASFIVLVHAGLAALAFSDPRLAAYPGGAQAAIGVGSSVAEHLAVTPFLLALAEAVFLSPRRARRGGACTRR